MAEHGQQPQQMHQPQENTNNHDQHHQPQHQEQPSGPSEICPACDKEVTRSDHKVNNHGQTFHSNCFTCAYCGQKLAGKPFFTQHDKRICKSCYTDRIAPKCAQCGDPVTGQSVTTGDKKLSYHPNCFRCFRCNKPISASYRIDTKTGKPEHSYNCIEDENVAGAATGAPADQKPKDSCRDCGKELVNVRYFILEDGMKVCDHCFKYNHCATCYKCNKPIISGQSHTVKDWKFHKDCFICPNCGQYMGQNRLKIQDNQVCCFQCNSSTGQHQQQPSEQPQQQQQQPQQQQPQQPQQPQQAQSQQEQQKRPSQQQQKPHQQQQPIYDQQQYEGQVRHSHGQTYQQQNYEQAPPDYQQQRYSTQSGQKQQQQQQQQQPPPPPPQQQKKPSTAQRPSQTTHNTQKTQK
ncbi:four and a half LIM domains protein 5-like isoform X2 [Convolutriloba macropyga]|uniref:four and a half LIM domains protein 5-like isoform X2 n=1 Tax=Convolutriloba macropyga TaxID=536237 RepID=UPI003F525389